MRVAVTDPFNAVDDPALPSLAAALDPVTVERQFNRRLKTLRGGGGVIRLRSISVIRHKPRRRCVIEYRMAVPRHGVTESTTLIGKVRARRFGKEGYRRLKAFWDAGFRDDSPDGISVPEPVGTVSEFRMWLQRKVPGTVATHLLTDPAAPLMARKFAEAAHKVHQTHIPIESRHTVDDEVRILRERLPAVWEREPRLRNRIREVLEAAARVATTVPEASPHLIHRDFYSDQVVVDGDRLHLLDFDLCCVGDTALDIGNFVGHITEYSLRNLGDAERLRPVEQAMEDRFVELGGANVRPALRAYTILTLVRHIYLSTVLPERRASTDRILELCESRLHRDFAATN